MKIKFYSISLGILLMLIGISSFAQSSKIENNKATAMKFIDSWNKYDSLGMARLHAIEFIYRDMAFGLELKTEKQLISFINATIKAVPDFKLVPQNIIANDSMVVVEWIWTGTYLGGWGPDYPGNNKAFKIKGVSVMVIENNRIKRNYDYYDKQPFRKPYPSN